MPSFFDQAINRHNTDSVKYSVKPGEEDIIPLWIADMDFQSPPAVSQALAKLADFGVFGYTQPGYEYDEIVCAWYKKNFNWDFQPEWNIRTPGVVFTIAAAIRAYTKENEAVIVQQPIYPPFMDAILLSNRQVIVNELKLDDGVYHIDFTDFENKIRDNAVKLFILCSPHNPIGRVWSAEELRHLADICLRHNVIVIADEIHSDFVIKPHQHTIFASLSPAVAEMTVTCTAPTKTFNLAGLQVANTFISNEKLRTVFIDEYNKMDYHLLNMAGVTAAKAAYLEGQAWLDELRQYLGENRLFFKAVLEKTQGRIKLIEPEGTYLLWLDCRGLGMNDDDLNDFFIKKARLRFNPGIKFGNSGSGFMRMNIACPKATLVKAADNLLKALAEI